MKSARLQALRAAWEPRARRIDALSLRERVILFLAIVAVLALVLDALVLTPLATQAQARAAAASQQSDEVKALRERFVSQSRRDADPAAQRLRAELVAAQSEREHLDGALHQGRSQSAEAGTALPGVLQRLLAQQSGLSLSRLAFVDAPAGLAQMPGMSWQALDLQVQGEFGQALAYVKTLEQQLPELQWGELRLSASKDGTGPRLQAQLLVLKVSP